MNIFNMSRDKARKELANLINNTPVDQLIADLKKCGAKFEESTCFERKALSYKFSGNTLYSKTNVYLETDSKLFTFDENDGQVRTSILKYIFGGKGEMVA